jgi:hypothetical protein
VLSVLLVAACLQVDVTLCGAVNTAPSAYVSSIMSVHMMSCYVTVCCAVLQQQQGLTAVLCFDALLYRYKHNSYAFVALGELPAFIAGWCLTLEFGVSGSAVAVSASQMLSYLSLT